MQWAPSLLVPQCTPTFASTFLLPLVSREQVVLGQRQAHSTLSLGSEVSGTPKERRDEARWGVKAKTGGWLGQVPQKQTCSQGSRTVHTGGDANRPGDEQGREGATLFLGGHLDTGGIGREGATKGGRAPLPEHYAARGSNRKTPPCPHLHLRAPSRVTPATQDGKAAEPGTPIIGGQVCSKSRAQ